MLFCVLLCILEAVEGALCLLEVPEVAEVMRRVPICTLEAVEGAICSLEVLEVMRRVLRMLEPVERGLCLLELECNTPCAALYVGGRGG